MITSPDTRKVTKPRDGAAGLVARVRDRRNAHKILIGKTSREET
jgi:hypothetical protein